MKTCVVQIGNSDDKLTQREWNSFVNEVHEITEKYIIHFSAPSPGAAPWQNFCIVFQVEELKEWGFDLFKEQLSEIGKKYKQDSIALTIGETYFV